MAGGGFSSVAAIPDSFGGGGLGGCGLGGCGGGFFAGAGFASRVDLLVGYRYFQLQEDFRATEKLYPSGPTHIAGSYFELDDRIDTQNDFHGLELGAIWQLQRGRTLWDFGWSAAFGSLTRRYRANGTTEFYASENFSNSYPGGFLVRPENVGSYEDTKFTVLPQARIGWGYCLCNNMRLNLGYSVLYLDDAFRPGSLMSTSFDGQTLGVDPVDDDYVGSQVGPTSAESVLLHALSLGISLNY